MPAAVRNRMTRLQKATRGLEIELIRFRHDDRRRARLAGQIEEASNSAGLGVRSTHMAAFMTKRGQVGTFETKSRPAVGERCAMSVFNAQYLVRRGREHHRGRKATATRAAAPRWSRCPSGS